MNLEDLAKGVLKFSPIIATALGSPIGGIIASLLAHEFNVNPENLTATIATDPSAEFKIKQFELKNAEDIRKTQVAEFSKEVDDRSSARVMEESDVNKMGKRDWILHFIAITFTLGLFSYILIVIACKFPFDEHLFHDLLNEESIVLLFYFGGIYKQK